MYAVMIRSIITCEAILWSGTANLGTTQAELYTKTARLVCFGEIEAVKAVLWQSFQAEYCGSKICVQFNLHVFSTTDI